MNRHSASVENTKICETCQSLLELGGQNYLQILDQPFMIYQQLYL